MTKQMTKKRRKQSAFTLVELLVVIAILAVLISVVVIGYTQFIDKTHRAKADSEARQVKTVLQGHMVLEDEVEVKNGEGETETTIVKLKFEYDENNVPTLTYVEGTAELDSAKFKAAFPDLEGLDGDFEFDGEETVSAGTPITTITYVHKFKDKRYPSDIEIAELFLHQEVPEP